MQHSVRVRHRRLRRAANHRPRHHILPLMALFLATVVGIATAGAASLFVGYNQMADELPADPEVAFAQQNLGPAKIFDRRGTLLYEFEDETEGLRNPVKLAEISPFLINATIATEDNSFYSNPGINSRGLARAGVENFITTDTGVLQGSGGSSITQQLVKNVFIPQEQRYERDIGRKIKETVFALELSRRYSKDQILEWYLNQIHYGNRSNGIGAASQRYFGVSAKDLTLAQAALLAGLPQSPARYDPYQNREAAVARQHEVLGLMVRHGHITQAEADQAMAEPLNFAEPKVVLIAPHWVFYVRDLLIAQFGVERFRNGGLSVVTTLDLTLQQKAEQIVEEKIAFYESPQGGNCECRNSSLVAIDNNTGQILVMVGSRNYWRADIEGENNNAIAIKQPGSAFKPFVYLAAFEKGWNPGTIIYDQPTKFISRIDGVRREYFTPEGPTRNFLGPLSARDSLASSMNTAAVKAAGFVGVDTVIDTAHRLGITSLNDRENYGVSIATGGSNMTLLDLTYAYTVLANNGEMRGVPVPKETPGLRRIDPAALLSVKDGNGNVLFEYKEPMREQVVKSGYAYQITDILKDNNAKRHTYNAPEVQFGMPDRRPVAAKTGTQQGPRDIKTVLATWNFGYVPDLTVGVWVGNANNALVNANLTSASSSLLIWKEFMAAAVQMLNIPPKDFPVPGDIEWQMVNGKREPIVRGTNIVRTEDLRLWAEAGNPTSPQIRGAQPPSSGQQPGSAAPVARTPVQQAPVPTQTAPSDGGGQATPAQPTEAPAQPPAGAGQPQPQPQPQPAETPAPGGQPAPPPPPVATPPPAAPPGGPSCRPGPPLYTPCPRN